MHNIRILITKNKKIFDASTNYFFFQVLYHIRTSSCCSLNVQQPVSNAKSYVKINSTTPFNEGSANYYLHSSQFQGLCSMESSIQMLQILPYFFIEVRPFLFFIWRYIFFLWWMFWSISMWARAIIIQKNKPNEKQKSKIGFS